ncbi:hypothetical protein [Ancylomarina longa]|uniref:Uncharacterized protein n=1 Tax=Ancylomarina longa TaxID=2487017 RepID=A0A434AWA0_9BACT|nr:hypothetical protein [Ancylomarina longa]RUT78762.1 hypothetical protein DLK05_06380 [Ancylomarina longa]
MSDQQNLLDHLEEIKAVLNEEMVYCDMPYLVYINECEGLHTRAQLDLPMLEAFNFDATKLDRLLDLTGALRTAQSNWESMKTDKQKAIDAWEKEAPAMYELHDDLIAQMSFAFRADASLLKKLAAIKVGDSRADTIQDMASLSVLGKENKELLTAINFDLSQLDIAAEMADKVGGLLGDINGRMYFEDDIKLIRDKAFTLTKQVVDEIRSYGKFVFRKNEAKRQAYSSKYHRERVAAYRKAKAAEAKTN